MRLPLFQSMAPSIGLTRSVFAACQDARFPFWRLKSVLNGLLSHELPQIDLQLAQDLIRLPLPETAPGSGIFYSPAFSKFLNDDAMTVIVGFYETPPIDVPGGGH